MNLDCKQVGMVIAIDGPAGAGKSTVAKELAERLGFEFLDTGAMYRCVTLAAVRAQIPTEDHGAIAELSGQLRIQLDGERVLMNDEDVTREIRTPAIAERIGAIADNVAVRKQLSQLQRDWTQGRKVVTEGRDQGSEVFYDSPCKFFLTASPEERARRRQLELESRGTIMDYEAVLRQQTQRDQDDYARPVGALRKADDAIEFCTDGLSLSSVVEQLAQIVSRRMENQCGCEPPQAAHPNGAP